MLVSKGNCFREQERAVVPSKDAYWDSLLHIWNNIATSELLSPLAIPDIHNVHFVLRLLLAEASNKLRCLLGSNIIDCPKILCWAQSAPNSCGLYAPCYPMDSWSMGWGPPFLGSTGQDCSWCNPLLNSKRKQSHIQSLLIGFKPVGMC